MSASSALRISVDAGIPCTARRYASRNAGVRMAPRSARAMSTLERSVDDATVVSATMIASATSVDFTAHNYPAVATAMALLIFVAALMGWWALRSYSPRRATA